MLDTLQQILGLYVSYLGSGLALLLIFSMLYLKITPADEMSLIRQGLIAPALSFGGAVIGFSLTLASSAVHTNALVQFIMWGTLAGVVQILTFVVMSLLLKGVSQQIRQNNIALGALIGSVSLAVGILNAGCLS